jgi:hypothetical protein
MVTKWPPTTRSLSNMTAAAAVNAMIVASYAFNPHEVLVQLATETYTPYCRDVELNLNTATVLKPVGFEFII